MAEWAGNRERSSRLSVSAEWPGSGAMEGAAVIVANAARDHERAVAWALAHGAHTLVEKPIAHSAVAAERLVHVQGRAERRLAAAQVFLYARYFENFCATVAAAGPVEAVTFDWADPAREERYGESKQYDPGVPVFVDWLPHVVPMLGALTQVEPDRCHAIHFARGGARCDLELFAGPVRCEVSLERNASMRRRVIRVEAGGQAYQLDFSTEPGTLSSAHDSSVADPDWHTGPRPLARMLTAFLGWAAGGGWDDRLDTSMAIQACRFAEVVAVPYRRAAARQMTEGLAAPDGGHPDLRYALAEALQANGRLPESELETRILRLRHRFSLPDGPDRQREILTSSDPFSVLDGLAGAECA